ncbi:MAG: thymidine phosphorylase [Myxococcota bacterium]
MSSHGSARSVPEIIATKRDGGTLVEADLHRLIESFTAGTTPDYQMTAFTMAVYFQGMTFDETVALTTAMRDSGKTLKFKSLQGPIVDKHSTGGVGDKATIALAPMVASCGAVVPTMSGRGLGHTGGTLDKLESIPGFHVGLSEDALRKQLARTGCALIGQTNELAPADRRLYALRDVTATVESIPLITASILSKKLAAGIEHLVLDVKVGRGAFMKTFQDAKALAKSLVRVGRTAGTQVSAILTDMNSPLGFAVGNAIETAEALDVLHGRGPDDVTEVTFALGAEMLRSAGIAKSEASARRRLESAVANGDALAKMRELVRAQGGDPRVVDEPDRLPKAKYRAKVAASQSGYVRDIDAQEVGRASMRLGAGRTRAEDAVDPSAGVLLHAQRGDQVESGQPLATLYAAKRSLLAQVRGQVLDAITIGRSKPRKRPRIIETLRR